MSEALLQSLVVVQKQTNYSAAALGIQNELHSILKLSKNVSFWVCNVVLNQVCKYIGWQNYLQINGFEA